MQTKVLAIDIGGTNTKLALVDDRGRLSRVLSISTSNEGGIDGYLERIIKTAKQLLEEQQKDSVLGVGIGVAGFIDSAHQKMIFNPNIQWLEGINLADLIHRELRYPVSLEIDSNAAALGEVIHGNRKLGERILVLSIGTGLGGGMVVDGEILRISNECLGDIGHVIVEPGGPTCASGCSGCAEAMVSAGALLRYASEIISDGNPTPRFEKNSNSQPLKVSAIIQSILNHEPFAVRAIQKMGKYFGIAIASIVPILSPDMICVAGGISESGEYFLDATTQSFRAISGASYHENVTIQKAKLGWQSVLVGAAEAYRCSMKY